MRRCIALHRYVSNEPPAIAAKVVADEGLEGFYIEDGVAEEHEPQYMWERPVQAFSSSEALHGATKDAEQTAQQYWRKEPRSQPVLIRVPPYALKRCRDVQAKRHDDPHCLEEELS